MKENDKKLKDLFREKNLENAFSPDEQNWKKMAAVLEDERKGNKKGLIYISLLLLLGGFGSALYFGLSTPELNPASTSQQKTLAQTPQSSESIVSPNEEIENTTTAPSKTKSTDIKQNTLKSNPLSQKILPSTSKPVASVSQEQKPIVKTPEERPVISNEKPKKADLTNSPEPVTKQFESQALIKSQSPSENNPAEKVASKDPDKQKQKTVSAPVLTKPVRLEDKKGEDKNSEKSLTKEALTPVINADNSVAENQIMPDLMFMKNAPVQERESGLAPQIAYPINDSLVYNPIPSHRIYLEAGTSYLMGWNNGTEAKGFNPLAGLQYYHDINKRMGLSLGVMYTTIDHLSNTSHTSTTTHLKFGEEADVTVISALKMHYLLVPLKLNYAVSRNDFFGIGYTLAWLLDAESKVENYQTRQNYSSTAVVSKSNGYTKGFSPYDGQIAACYRRRLYKEFYVSGELFYGLRDVKNNGIYQSSEFDRNVGFRLSLGINLWKNN